MSSYVIILVLSSFFFFLFNDTATTEIYTLSLHDALPISHRSERWCRGVDRGREGEGDRQAQLRLQRPDRRLRVSGRGWRYRPDQSHPHGAAERRVHRGTAPHHRVRGGGEEGEGEDAPDARRRWHGRDVLIA